LNILIVENHPDTLDALKGYLQDSGHRVTTAMTVAEATRLLPELNADMLICDIGLPDGSGWELMNRVPRHVFAVAMSGFGMNSDSVKSRAAGFRHHLLKPFKSAEIDNILAEASAERAMSK
jgi:CheY-like chemotaxis protein